MHVAHAGRNAPGCPPGARRRPSRGHRLARGDQCDRQRRDQAGGASSAPGPRHARRAGEPPGPDARVEIVPIRSHGVRVRVRNRRRRRTPARRARPATDCRRRRLLPRAHRRALPRRRSTRRTDRNQHGPDHGVRAGAASYQASSLPSSPTSSSTLSSTSSGTRILKVTPSRSNSTSLWRES